VDTQNNYLWAGATDIPKPTAVTATGSSSLGSAGRDSTGTAA